MFSIDQLKEAYLKVKSRADFPAYVQDLIHLGVNSYETYVTDGSSSFFGSNNYNIQSERKYPSIFVSERSKPEDFRTYLEEHKQEKTHYVTLCKHAAAAGVEKWVVNTETMRCTYFDKSGREVFSEPIPAIEKNGSFSKSQK